MEEQETKKKATPKKTVKKEMNEPKQSEDIKNKKETAKKDAKEVKKTTKKETTKKITEKVGETKKSTTKKEEPKKASKISTDIKSSESEKERKRNENKKESKTNESKKDEKRIAYEKLIDKATDEALKPYKVLSYIGILWLIGLFIPEKDDEKLKFHVGQGIILSIVEFIVMLAIGILKETIIFDIFRQEIFYNNKPTGIYTINIFPSAIIFLIELFIVLIIFYYIFIGISNVLNDKEEELPIIGKHSFYK